MHNLQDSLARQTWSVFHTSGRAKGMGTRLGQTPGQIAYVASYSIQPLAGSLQHSLQNLRSQALS